MTDLWGDCTGPYVAASQTRDGKNHARLVDSRDFTTSVPLPTADSVRMDWQDGTVGVVSGGAPGTVLTSSSSIDTTGRNELNLYSFGGEIEAVNLSRLEVEDTLLDLASSGGNTAFVLSISFMQFEGTVQLYDVAGRAGKLEKVCSVPGFCGKIVALSPDMAVMTNADLTLLDMRAQNGVVQVEQGVGGFSHFATISGEKFFTLIRPPSSSRVDTADSKDKLIIKPLDSGIVKKGFVIEIQVNARLLPSRTVIEMFAWHPAQGNLVVVLQCGRLPEVLYEIFVVNPHTLQVSADPKIIKSATRLTFLPGHVCGMPVILAVDNTTGGVNIVNL